MLKGEKPDEVFIAPMTSVKVYIDEDEVAMWCICRIESGRQVCSVPQVLSIGPIKEVVCERLSRLYYFVVGYLRSDGYALAKQGHYQGDIVWWSDEVKAEPNFALSQWRNIN